MKIVKHRGDIVDYDPEKLRRSLMKSGANNQLVEEILKKIEGEIYEGISTKLIYKHAFNLLKKVSSSHAARYNLKEAIRLLGPAGFFFEKYIERLFVAEKYETQSNLILKGHCVSHEIDIVVRKNNVIAMVECKFHQGKDANSDVKVPMYILSRFNDIKSNKHLMFDIQGNVSKCWIVTNSRFTTDAVDFGLCSGLNLLSWNYPEDNNLKTKNDTDHLYPVTCLTSLSQAEKEKLLILDLILVKELINKSDSLIKIGLSPARVKNVLKEVSDLSGYFLK